MSNPFETLEPRQMMSAAVQAGVLQVVGTDADDAISVALQGSRIVVTTNGVRQGSFARGAVKKISIDARNGDDRVEIATSLTTRALVHGGNGDDVILGGGGSDTIFGEDGDDVLRGRQGDDTLDPGVGHNSVDGGAGIDKVSYATSTTKTIYIDLDNQNAWMNNDTEPSDSFLGVENAEGSNGDDVIYGSKKSTAIWGGGGNDRVQQYKYGTPTSIFGGDGNDTIAAVRDATNLLDGGAGTDTVDYGNHPNGVNVSFDGVANDGAPGENDTLRNFENAKGGNGADTLTGDDSPNKLYGDWGNDVLNGLGGNDTLYGDDDNDNLDGGEGDDVLYGEDDNDSLTGGGGADALYGGSGADKLFARDFEGDYVNGGEGSDKALVDSLDNGLNNKDTVVQVEVIGKLFGI